MTQLGRYEIIEQMGTGAMGNVYRARDTALDRPVALKTIRTGVDVAPEIRQRFYREARACARLQHPNIITVFDLGEADNTAYIAMELLEGADFRRIIQERRPIPVEARIAACVDVCEAIAHAHRHGVIHRDIKPSNLFLTDEGRTKVLDFGIARLPSSKLTVAGQILGTPNYMAPEQILARPSDGRADLFSAAVVFFEFLTFVHPFQSNFIPRRIVQGEPDSLFDRDTSLPVILEKVLARGLAKEPDQRYQTGDEFAADLRTVLDALRGNASPTFSGIRLPSQDAIPHQNESQPEPAPTFEAPPGQDPQEWRLSEALRLLPEFEAAIEARDLAKANGVTQELDSRLAGDVRFADALRLCHSRLSELESRKAPAPAPSRPTATAPVNRAMVTAPIEIVPERTPPGPPAKLPQTVSGQAETVDLDATFFASTIKTSVDFRPQPGEPPVSSLPPEPLARPVETTPRISDPTPTPTPLPIPQRVSPAPVAQSRPGRGKALAIGGIVVGAILVLIAGVYALRPVKVEASVATAAVKVAAADILVNARAGSAKITSLTKGTRLNVLSLPGSASDEWTNVQPVSPKVFRSGYVRTSELGDWQSQNSVVALGLIRKFGKGDAGTEEEIRAQTQELDSLVARFNGEASAKDAELDAAHLLLILAQRSKEAGAPDDVWQSDLRTARHELEPLAADPNYQAKLLDLNNQIDKLLAGKSPTTVSQPPPTAANSAPKQDVKELMAKARSLWSDGDYEEAQKKLKQILAQNPRNKDAQDLLNKIKKALNDEIK